jgi:ATP-dependent RNA helicase DDX18/HAS1
MHTNSSIAMFASTGQVWPSLLDNMCIRYTMGTNTRVHCPRMAQLYTRCGWNTRLSPARAERRDGERPGEGGGESGDDSRLYRTKKRPNTREFSRAPEIPIARVGTGSTSDFFSARSWKELGTQDEVVTALKAISISRPSHIQAESFGALIGENASVKHVLLADHAGSGKTLSYLVPLIQRLKDKEAVSGKAVGRPGQPRIVIIVPTAELCNQVLRVCRALSKSLKFRSAICTGGHPMRTQKQALQQGVDIVVGTPGRLAELESNGSLSYKNCSHVVLDEADVLLGPASTFAEQIVPIKDKCTDETQFVLVTATLPSDIYSDIEYLFPGIVSALGPGLHRTAPGCIEQIIDCSGGDEISEESGIQRKSAALLGSLQEQKSNRTIVFCNKIETCRKVENFLNRSLLTDTDGNDFEVLPYHAAIAPIQRDRNLTKFLQIPGSEKNSKGDNGGVKKLIMVCTDRASRGVDSAYVEHVVLFDFPREPSEYVRRVGRTARGAGGEGVVTVLVLGRQVKLAQHVSSRNQKGLPVHAVPSVIPLKPIKRAARKE